jgi:hypothetical protein
MQAATAPAPSTFIGPAPVGRDVGRLEATLLRVGDLCQALKAGRSDVEPHQVFSELRVDLELHFALEEANAYFGVVLRERPSLSHGVNKLRHEHVELLDQLEALRKSAADPLGWPELAQRAAALIDAFRAHEREESELLQEFFLRDDGVGAD